MNPCPTHPNQACNCSTMPPPLSPAPKTKRAMEVTGVETRAAKRKRDATETAQQQIVHLPQDPEAEAGPSGLQQRETQTASQPQPPLSPTQQLIKAAAQLRTCMANIEEKRFTPSVKVIHLLGELRNVSYHIDCIISALSHSQKHEEPAATALVDEFQQWLNDPLIKQGNNWVKFLDLTFHGDLKTTTNAPIDISDQRLLEAIFTTQRWTELESMVKTALAIVSKDKD